MIFEVEVYVINGNGACETIVVDMDGKNEADVRARMIRALNSKSSFVGVGSGVFQKNNVCGTCVIRQKKVRKGKKHGI